MKSPLYKHQQDGINFLLADGRCLFWEVGTGKTRTIIEMFLRLKQSYPQAKMLVVCPISLIENAWGVDIKKYSSLTYCNMRKNITDADIYITNYEIIASKKRWQEMLKLIQKHDFLCCLDESTRLKNPTGVTTRKFHLIAGMFKRRIIMTGTPCLNTELDLWGQVRFACPYILPDKFFAFRNKYFQLQRGKQIINPQGLDKATISSLFSKGFTWNIIPEMKEHLLRQLSQVCMWIKKKDCLDLPEQIDQTRLVELTEEMRKAYKEMLKDRITEIENQAVVAPIILTKLMKLRQITSGFSITPDGNIVSFKTNPKLAELMATLDEIGQNQVIIWTNFKEERRVLQETLKTKAQRLDGETTDRDAVIQGFINNDFQYLIADKRSVAHGLTFVNCAYQVFYSLDYSAETYEQARGRTHRAGQTKACVYIHLIAKDTIDEIIMEVLDKKIDNQEMIRKLMLC